MCVNVRKMGFSMEFIGYAVTDAGTVKKVNQDSLMLKIARSKWGNVCLGVICDGISGLSLGELASATIVRGFEQWFHETFSNQDVRWTECQIKKSLIELVQALNDRIYQYGSKNGCRLGSTLTAVLFLEERFYLVHVGDCRLYQISEKHMIQLTTDQTWMEMELRKGIFEREILEKDARKNMLLQSIGTSEQLSIDYMSGETSKTDSYLLCSDGFRHQISEEELLYALKPARNKDIKEMKRNLEKVVALCKNRQEHDNISAVLMRSFSHPTICISP